MAFGQYVAHVSFVTDAGTNPTIGMTKTASALRFCASRIVFVTDAGARVVASVSQAPRIAGSAVDVVAA